MERYILLEPSIVAERVPRIEAVHWVRQCLDRNGRPIPRIRIVSQAIIDDHRRVDHNLIAHIVRGRRRRQEKERTGQSRTPEMRQIRRDTWRLVTVMECLMRMMHVRRIMATRVMSRLRQGTRRSRIRTISGTFPRMMRTHIRTFCR